jgi:cytochrome c biogenesis protein CcmG, thiol:disulfide interchange protein DsbE
MTMQKVLSVLIVLSLAGLVLAACGDSGPVRELSLTEASPAAGATPIATSTSPAFADKVTVTPNPKAPAVKVAVGSTAPDFVLRDLDGNDVALSDYRGKPLLINFWATWCPPCRQELPLIQRTYEANIGAFEVLGVDVREEPVRVRLMVSEFSLTYNTVLDTDGKVAISYKATSFPTSFFLDKNGVIKSIRIGELTETTMRGEVAKIMDK